jgi:hypothetical protein
MDRRKFLIGMGSLAAGSAAAMGTGAFTKVEAKRGLDVSVATDNQAYLRLAPSDGENGVYAGGWGKDMEIHLNDAAMGDGVNVQAVTQIDNIFVIENQGTQEVSVTIDDSDLIPTSEFDKNQLEEMLTFYTGSDPANDEIEEEEGVKLNVGESKSVGIEVDIPNHKPYSGNLTQITKEGQGDLIIKAEAVGNTT